MSKVIFVAVAITLSFAVLPAQANDEKRSMRSRIGRALLPDRIYKGFKKGIASFYGAKFHGKKTASGEIFDQNEMTCAHRTLPFGTELEVTNPDNGKTVNVTVNDRGPFMKNRVLDLSKAAARKLGITGLAKVVFRSKNKVAKSDGNAIH